MKVSEHKNYGSHTPCTIVTIDAPPIKTLNADKRPLFPSMGMTNLLEKAMAETLSDSEQDAIAALILEEINDEAFWDKAFEESQDALVKFAAEAIAEDRAGKTKDLDPEKL